MPSRMSPAGALSRRAGEGRCYRYPELTAGAELAAMHRGGGAAGTGIPVLEPVIRHLLQLLLGTIQSNAVVVGFQIAQLDADALAAHAEEGADIDDNSRDLAILVEDQIADLADVAVLHVIDRAADHLAAA